MTLIELAERCEKAEGPDRELDAQIILAFDHPEYHYPNEVLNRRPSSYVEAADRFRHDGMGGSYPYPAFTASIDAAMTLVPEGMILRRYWTTKHVPHCVEISVGPDNGGWISEADNSFALALCAAALRARASAG